MKNKKVKFISFLMMLGLFISGCEAGVNSGTSSSTSKQVTDATIVDFNVKEGSTELIDVGDTYLVPSVRAKDNYGNYYVADISATDPDGQDVTVEDDSFVCYKMGVYTVTYTVNYNISDSISKSFYVEALDVSAPTVDTELYIHNICRPGQVIDLSDIKIVDNSGEEITPEINVLFNGVEEPDAIVDNKLTASKEGTYILEISATDSSENSMLEEYYIYTLMDFEHGYSFDQNDTYGTDVVDDYAFNGNYSYEFGAFDANPSWFNDYSMLGYVKILDDEAKYVSFWIYFEDEAYTDILKAIYHDTKVYDSTGNELPEYHLGGYEMKGGNWYRFVVNMDELVLEGEFFDHDDVEANPDTLGMIPFYFGVWDPANNDSAKRSQKVYIDDVKLTNNPEEENYKAPVSDYDFPENCVVDFETKEQTEALKASWRSNYGLSKNQKTSGEYSVRFEPFITYSSLTFTGFCSGVNDLSEYNTINANFYIEDNSGNNVYDSETYVNISLYHTSKEGVKKSLQSYSIKENKKWISLSFDLGDYNQDNLASGCFSFWVSKYIYKEVVKTYEYEDVAIYVDDIYAEDKKGFVAGKEIVNIPYASKAGGSDIYSQVSTSETGYVETSVAKYGIGHGTHENYTMYNKNDLGQAKSDTVSGLTSEYQYYAARTDRVLTIIEATDHCFARFTIDETLFDPYIWGNVYIRKYTAASNSWTQISKVQTGDKSLLTQAVQCEYYELQAGDKLVLDIDNQSGSYRYFKYPSGVAIATPLVEGETIQLDTPTNLVVSEEYGLNKFTFDSVNSADSYELRILDSENNIIEGFEALTINNGEELELSASLEEGTYYAQIRAIGSGIFGSSEYTEKVEFTVTAPEELTIEEVKAALLNAENAFNAQENIKTLIGGGTDENINIGLLEGETNLPIAPGNANGWCGFKAGAGFSVQFIENKAADSFYYSYTAKQGGYVYIDQQFVAWYSNNTMTVTASVNGEEIYSKQHTLITDQTFNDKVAVYLERGETLTIKFKHDTNPTASTVASKKINITFVATKEAALPEGYDSLIAYLNA